MNPHYTIYLVERPRTGAEQRDEDQSAGELSAALAEVWHSLKKPVRWSRHPGIQEHRHPHSAAA